MKPTFLLFVLLALASCQSNTPSKKILFSSGRNGNSDIFLMNTDGSDVTPIIKGTNEEWGATFTDANNITFMRQIKDSVFRFSYNLSTKEEQKLTPLRGCYLDDKNVVYSKNGDYAFSCGLELFLKKKDDEKFIKLNTGSRNTPNYLSWTFDGKKILYTDNLTGSNDVYAIDIETQSIENLTQSNSNDERGDLSPDGKWLVYSSNQHNAKDQDLFILNLETKEAENITNSSGYDLIGRWDLDGKSILYGSNKDGNWEIYRYVLADKSTVRLTNDAAFDGDPRVR